MGVRIGVDSSMGRWPTRGFRTGMASSRPVLVARWWLRVLLYSALYAVLDWFNGRMLVRLGGKSGGVVAARPVDVRPVPRKEPCQVEGWTPYNVLISERWPWLPRGGLDRTCHLCFPRPDTPWAVWWGRLQKERRDECLFPITPLVTGVLGGKAAGAFNAPALVRASRW